jgi:hypothetical protein
MTTRQIVEDAVSPNGKAAVLVRCGCKKHPEGRTQALVSKACADAMRANATTVRIHGFVALAHHPALSRAPQIQANGPWAA